MKLKITYLSLFFCLFQALYAQETSVGYQYFVNTHALADGNLEIAVDLPEVVTREDEVFFCFPKLLPDDYEQKDFGQFVLSLRAYGKNDKELKVERIDINTWQISRAKKLTRITYQLEDTWQSQRDHQVALAEGSSFERRKRIFMNPSACFGYIHGFEELPFDVSVDRAAAMRIATTLETEQQDFDTDILRASNYFELLHSPILIAMSDTTTLMLDSTAVQLSVYSAEDKIDAAYLRTRLESVLADMHRQFEGINHKEDYHLIVNVFERDGKKQIYNSLIANPENAVIAIAAEDVPKKGILERLASRALSRSYVSEELLSDKKRQFDYQNPSFSSHLWLYEGVQSYLTLLTRLRNGQMSLSNFADELQDVMRQNERFSHGYTLVELSENRLNEAYRKEINAIHTRGLLTAFCLDLRLLEISKGEKGLWHLTGELLQSLETPFKDDFLFTQVAALSSGQVQDFLNAYVAGKKMLDYQAFFQLIGLDYQLEGFEEVLSPFGGIDKGVLSLDSLQRFFIKRPERLDAFGKERIGFQEGDVILNWNGAALTPKSVSKVLLEYMNGAQQGMPVAIEIIRDGQPMTLKTTLEPVKIAQRHVLSLPEKLSSEQDTLRKAWLNQTTLLSQQ